MSLTNAQKEAIRARGNVLVVAGAGTGKTTTLVERCLDCLLREVPPVSLDEILMVTFTEAAAAEMRQRIRNRLIEEAERNPAQSHWPEQLALFETAHIGTLHSFCLQLVRQHFYELELDPQVSVLPEEEARLQANEVLEQLLQKHYAGKSEAAAAVQELIQSHARGWDEPIRRLVLRLHHYTQTLPDPSRWIEEQRAGFAAPEPILWKGWRAQAITDWSAEQLATTNRAAGTNPIAARCAALLDQLQSASTVAAQTPLLKSIVDTAAECPSGRKGAWLDPLENFFADAGFLLSICAGATDPLLEDWTWIRSHMLTILGLTREFTQAFTEAKRELGVLDFHDLEQYALRLLWDSQRNEPTPIAREWRQKLRFLFIDEYQDINAAQDQILQALGREGDGANRFLVGDIKQSIYRFRLANPYIFRRYLQTWGKGPGTVIPLVDNFRSREAILDFINDFFGPIMCAEMGGVAYDEGTRLRFGAPGERVPLSAKACPTPSVELLLREKKASDSANGDDSAPEVPSQLAELEEAQKEARLLGLRLLELKSTKHRVWDPALKDFRPAEWRDMAVLLRAPANKAESYVKEFARLNIPLEVARRGFYQSVEISDLVSLLQILDNPLQDIPVLAVLHSPLVGLTLNELAEIRLALPKGHFWNAVARWIETNRAPAVSSASAAKQQLAKKSGKDSNLQGPRATNPEPSNQQQLLAFSEQGTQASTVLGGKLTAFLERYNRWRRLVRQVSLSRCLESILAETHYAEWLLIQSQGEQRYANVQRLIGLAERFNQFQRQGLFRFLRFIAGQQAADTEPEVRAVNEEDAVRLMSIHQSKGLEFPIVVLADLAKPFNRMDMRGDIILDETYGICPQIKPPHTGSRYPSLPYWLARRRQNQELLGEELRLLYVGMTRARDTLILSASVAASRLEKAWSTRQPLTLELLRGAQSYADWLAWWFAFKLNDPEDFLNQREGQVGRLRWTRHNDWSLVGKLSDEPASVAGSDVTNPDAEPEVWQSLQQRLAWRYPWIAATRQPAKTSVSALRRRANVEQAESAPARWARAYGPGSVDIAVAGKNKTRESRISAAEIGDAHHTFLQFVSLEKTATVAALEQEAVRLESVGILTPAEVGALDLEALAGFWNSDLGGQIRSQAAHVRRELAFTARFSANELAPFSGDAIDPHLEQDYVVVQGIADLVVLLPQEIWLVDFKTDAIKASEIPAKTKFYEPQLWVYAQALSRTFNLPVSQAWLYFLAPRRAVPVESKRG